MIHISYIYIYIYIKLCQLYKFYLKYISVSSRLKWCNEKLQTFNKRNSYAVIFCLNSKVKVKYTLVHALRLCTGRTAHKGSRGIALLFLDHGTRSGEGSASRPGRSLPPGNTQYPLYRRLSGPEGRSGQVQKISPSPRFDLRTIQPVASRYTA